MKINKKMFICFLLVLMLFVCVNTASASDTLDTNLTSEDTADTLSVDDVDASQDELSASGDTYVVDQNGGGDYKNISAAVSAASGGETIFIKNGEYTETAKIDIGAKQLTFRGESQDGVIIRSGDNDLFYTTSSGYSSLVISGLTFKDISMTSSRIPIFIGGDGNVSISDCTFDNCASRYGAIRIYTSGSVIVDNCKLLNTKSSTGSYSSAIDFGGGSNTEYIIKNTVIDGSAISSSSTASYIFGAIYSEKTDGTVILDNVTISNCNLTRASGLIAAKGNMNIKRSKFVNNYVYRDLAIAGFIFVNGAKTVTVESSIIANNTKSNYFLTANSATASFNLNYNNIQGNEFNTAFTNPDNGVYTLDANYWGSNTLPDGITASTWIVDNNGIYELNTGDALEKEVPGLAPEEHIVLPEGTIYVSPTGDDANDGLNESTAIATIAHAVEIAKAKDNKTSTIYLLNGDYSTPAIDVTEVNLTFIGQEKGKVVIHGTGKYIFDVYGEYLISKFENIDFVDSYSPSGNMGALRLYADYSDFIINNCNFRNISAKYGAIDLQADYTNITISNCVVENVTGSTSMSAIVYINVAESSVNFDNIEIVNCGFDEKYASENPATYLRAIFYVASKTATVTLTNSKITNNYGAMYGGVIESKSKFTVDNTIISGNVVNTSVNGNNGGEYLIWASDDNADINIVSCVITDNTIVKTTKGLFYNQKGSMNIEYSNIGNNNVDKFIGSTGTITADNNWWGTNDQPGSMINNWVIMNVDVNDSDLGENNKVTFTIDFNHVKTSSGTVEELTGGEIPKDSYSIDLSAKNGEITPANVVVNKGQTLTKTFTVTEINDEITLSCDGDDVIITIEGIPPYRGIIYVNATGNDTNEGSIDAPVATIAKAIELANKGSHQIVINEGTYTGFGYKITGDLNVTGVGKVTLDANNAGRLFYMDYGDAADKIVLANLILTNANGYGAAVYSFASELILDNVTIVNTDSSGYLIKSNGKLTVKDSYIANSMAGDVIQQSAAGDILINNTVFENNVATDGNSVYAVIDLSSGSGNMVIEDSKFINNTVKQGVIRGYSSHNIYVKGTDFINNTNTWDGGAIYAYNYNGVLDITDSVFINNKAGRSGGAIYVGWKTTATIDKSIFIDNIVTGSEYYGDAIYNKNMLTITNSVLLTSSDKYLIYNDNGVASAQNNWWGTNDDPKDLVSSADASNWVTMDAAYAPEHAKLGDEVTVTATFSNAELPDGIRVTFTSTGDLNAVVSTVGGKASTTYTINAKDVAINATSGNAIISMPIAQDNIVTNATFYNFFDDTGVLLDTVAYEKLIFEGEFSNLPSYITIDRHLTITGNNAVLNDIGFIIAGDGVTLNSMELVANGNFGNLIDIAGTNAVISNMNITYVVSEAASAINVYPGANGAQILNNNIYFESTVDEYAADEVTTAICVDSGVSVFDFDVDPIEGLVIDGNNITAVIPAFLADAFENEYYVMGLSAVNGIRINGAKDLEFTNNNLNVNTNRLDRTTPTFQALYVASSSGLIDGNNISMIDTFTPAGKDVYLYAVELVYDEDLTISNNNFNLSTAGGKEEAGSAYAIIAIASEFSVVDNNITTVSNGPNLAIYFPSNMGAPCDSVIKGNFINVTGLATSAHNTGLVSGIEIQTGDVEIKENTIYTYSIGEYAEGNYIYGISYAQDGATPEVVITNNTIYTEGHYAISFLKVDDALITDNYLVSADLQGDGAVYIKSGSGNEVQDNLPTNIVTNATFYNFFDDSGVLLDTVIFDELIFKGEFSDLVDIIVIPDDITLTGDNAVLNNIALSVVGDDVSITGFTLNANDVNFDANGGAAIYVIGSDVTLDNVSVTYNAPSEVEAKAIFANGAENFKLTNSEIIFTGANPGENHYRGLEVRNSNAAKIDNNTISAVLPAVPVDWYGSGIAQDLVLAVGIQGGDDVEFTNNRVTVNTNGGVGSYPTVDAVMLHSANDILIKGNNITHVDTTTEDSARYYYSLDIYSTTGTVESNNIVVNTTAGVDRAGTAYPIQLTGPFTVTIKDNNLTAVSKGPIAGIYASNWAGEATLIVEYNNIEVTGYATTGNYALVAGIEAETDMFKAYNNIIVVNNGADYDDANQVIGVGIGASFFSGDPSADIKDNNIAVDGKYAVYYAKAVNTNVTGNTLYGHELKGDDAVIIKDGSNNIIMDNLPYVGLIYVDVAGSDENNGTIDDPVATIAKAVELALGNSGHIIVNEGTYDVPQIEITGDLDITGNGAVVFKAQDATKKAFWIKSGNVNISGVTFTNFNATYNGAVIRLDAGSLAIDNSKFIKNGGENRQALIQVKGANLTLTNTLFEENTASKTGTSYGNVYISNNGAIISNLYVDNCSFINNRNKYGGLYITGSIAAIYNSSFIGNNATSSSGGSGAAIFAAGTATYVSSYSGNLIEGLASNVLVEGCKFINNTAFGGTYYAGQGGAIYVNNNVTMSINDCLFENNKVMNTTGNDKPGQGGAIYASAGKVIVTNSIFKNNDATQGPEIYMRYYNSHLHPEEVNTLNISNSIILNDDVAVIADSDNGTYIANNNWWGTNDEPGDKVMNVTVESWAKMDASFTPADAYRGDEITVTAVFDVELPDGINVTFTSTSGVLNTVVVAKNGQASTTYTIGSNDVSIIATSTNAVVEIPIIKPLADITVVDSGTWIGTDGTVSVNVPNATGTVTIEINGKSYDVDLVDGVASKVIPAENLVAGENTVTATYNGPDFVTNNATGTLFVVDGVVTQDNYMHYFNQEDSGKFFDYVPEGVTLDFQGSIINPDQNVRIWFNVNKPVNIISSTEDAYIDLNTTSTSLTGENPGNRFTVSYGGSGSNITGINFHNTQLWIANTHHVVLDNISNVIEDQRVGGGVGATSVRENSTYVTVKNSYFYTRNNGGSSSLVMAWADYCTFDNNYIFVEGNSGNMIYLTTFNVNIPSGVVANVYNNITNNRFYSPGVTGSCWALTLSGSYNLIENNTIDYNGVGITTQFGTSSAPNNVYRGNVIIGGSMSVLPESIVYNNTVTGTLSVGADSIAYNNTVGGKVTVNARAKVYNNTFNGGLATGNTNSIIENNTIVGAVTINKVGTTFVGNDVTGTVTVSSNNNVIKGNNITSTGDYAVDLGSKTGNNVTENYLIANLYKGDVAVKYSNENNVVENNTPVAPIFVDTTAVWIGNNATVTVTVANTTGNVTIEINGKSKTVDLVDGVATVEVAGDDLVAGENTVVVTYEGSEYAPISVEDAIVVVAGVVTQDNYMYYFNQEDYGRFFDYVPEGTTLDFQGSIINPDQAITVQMNVNKPVNIISSTEDAYIDLNITEGSLLGETPANSFAITYGGSGSNVTGISFHNTPVLISAHDVVLDNINVVVDNQIEGSDMGAITVMDNSSQVVIKDSYLSANQTSGTVALMGETTLTGNIIMGTVTVSADNNVIKENSIISTDEYAIDLASNGNNVTENELIASSLMGDAAVNGNLDNNTVKYNYPNENNLSVSVENITIGETAKINVTIYYSATGDVKLTINGKNYYAPINDGFATFEIPDLSVRDYAIKVSYDGDGYVVAGECSAQFSVLKIKSDAIITTSDLIATEDVNVSVTIDGATGSVTLVVDDSSNVLTLTDGVAIYTIKSIKAGEHSVSVVYLGDGTHDSVINSTVFTVDKNPTEIKVNSTTIDYGETAEIDIIFSPEISATLLVEIGGNKESVNVKDGYAHMNITGLKSGIYVVNVTFAGDDYYGGSFNDTAIITVNPFDAELNASSSDINVSENATINVEINSEATGSVSVRLDDGIYPVTIVDGKGSVIIADLANGTYTAYVKFEGDDKFAASEVNTTFTVFKVELPKDMNVTMDIPEGTISPIFTIELPSDATGNFTVNVDGVNYTEEVVNGTATVYVGDLTAGNHNIFTSYSGNNKYDGVRSETKTVDLPKASIPGGDDAINNTSPEDNDSQTYSISLPSDATGNLTVTVDGKNYTKALVNGSATVTVPKLDGGNHNVTVTYSGDDKYSSISKNITVHTPTYAISKNKDINMLYTATATYKVLITKDGKAVGAGEEVTINFNGKDIVVKTDKNGYASFKLPKVKPKKAKYTITATYKDIKVSNKVKVKHIVKAKNKKVKKSKKVNKIKVSLKKVNGKYLKGKKLKLKLKGKTLKAKTNKKGVATFKIKKNILKKLKAGKKYTYKVTYLKDTVKKKITVKK